MRKISLAVGLAAIVTMPLIAQNTDIESLSGLQFNFGNPGARSLGMGGAFLGLADDASAAEANPAGLTVLRKSEVSLELHAYQERQLFTTSGTYPQIQRTAFKHFNHRLTFASVVIPIRNFTIGAYYHEPLHNQGTGTVVPVRNKLTGAIVTNVPNFYLPRGGTPVSRTDCENIRKQKNDPFACLEYTILPFLSSLTVQERTFGLAAAYKIGNVSVGLTARQQIFNESAFTYRVDRFGNVSSILVQATSDITEANQTARNTSDLTFGGGVKWNISDRLSVGAVYKQGSKFVAPTVGANADTNYEFKKIVPDKDTTFHIPDVYGLGISVNPIPVLKVNADAIRVTYSNLVDDFISSSDVVRGLGKVYRANNVIELHLGGEYFVLMKIPFAVRAGVWRDPAHSVEYRGPLNAADGIAEAILHPKGTTQTHFSIGGGLAWQRFQIDAAYDRSSQRSVASISTVARF